MSRVYAGVGSRQTPQDVLDLMSILGARLADLGWTLRSGNAPGADQAFQEAAWGHLMTIPEQDPPRVEVYLPWPDFHAPEKLQPSTIWHNNPTYQGVEAAIAHHPAGRRLSRGARLLHGRNSHQILGRLLNAPATMVVCWSPCGAQELDQLTRQSGGTGQAIRLARRNGIPVFNLKNPGALPALQAFVEQHP